MKKIVPFLILIILLTSCANSANDNSVKAVPTVPITTGAIGNDNSVKAIPTTVPITTGVIGYDNPVKAVPSVPIATDALIYNNSYFGKWKVKELLFVDDTGYLDYFQLETPNISYLDNVIGSEIYFGDNVFKLNGKVVSNKPEFQVYNRNKLPSPYASTYTLSVRDFNLRKQNNYLSLLHGFVDKGDYLLMVLYAGTEKNNTGRDRVLGNVYKLVR